MNPQNQIVVRESRHFAGRVSNSGFCLIRMVVVFSPADDSIIMVVSANAFQDSTKILN